MLERQPYKHMSHKEWRSSMAMATKVGPLGAKPQEIGLHLDCSRILREVVSTSHQGLPVSPHWTALPVLP